MTDHAHTHQTSRSAHPTITPDLHDPADAWHDHSHDEKPQVAHGEVGNPTLVMSVGVGLFLVVVLAVVVVDTFYRGYASKKLRELEVTTPNAPALLTRGERSSMFLSQQSKEPGWVVIPAAGEVPAKAVVQLPLEQAQGIVIQQYLSQTKAK